jgi:Colicin immunity protein / pyocin immunity protein
VDRDELIALVRRIMAGEGESQEEADSLVDRFVANVPHPRADDLIFYPDEEFGHEPSPEEVVDRALGYKPIELGPAGGSDDRP